jgi:F-box and WD-40 domain protein CDC4
VFGNVLSAADNTIRVWDVKTGSVKYVLDGHANGVRTVRFDDKIIGMKFRPATYSICALSHDYSTVSGSRDSTIKVWDLEQGIPLRTMAGHAYTVYCLEFDNRYIISGSVGMLSSSGSTC